MSLQTSAVIAICIATPFTATLILLTLRARRQAALVVARYQGTMSWLTDAVDFRYAGCHFTLRRLASNGGLAGTGYFCSLVLKLESGQKTVISPAGAVKYVYAFSVPDQHTWVTTPGSKIVIVGPSHHSIARTLSDPSLESFLQRIFPRHYSTVTFKRQVEVTSARLLHRQWNMELTGLPKDVYDNPDVLKPILDDMLRLRELVAGERAE